MAVMAVPPREAIEEMARRVIARKNLPNVLEGSFPEQKEFILDKTQLKALFCTRRSSKSYTAGLSLAYEALQNAYCNCLFIGLTRGSAKAIIWKDILQVINRKAGLNASFNQTELTMTLGNGSLIAVTGVDVDEEEMNKLLGRKYRLVVIDEASMYTIDLRNLIYGVLLPAMTDPNEEGESGMISVMGTASNFSRGLFYDITTGNEKGWKIFQWTAHDNPYVAKQWQHALDKIAQDRPLYMQTPQFKQWYLNQWVVDEEKLCYKFDPQKNTTATIPTLNPDGWTYVLGVDTGWEDASAFVLTAYHLNYPKMLVLKSYARSKMTFDEVVAKIQEFMRLDTAPHRVIIDGANKQGVESMRSRSQIPFEYADKQDKVTFIELLNSDLIEARIAILDNLDNRPLRDELMSLVWVTDGDKIKYPKKENPALSNHLCDAFLYAWRCGFHYASEPLKAKIVKGSREWYIDQSKDIWDREREKLENEFYGDDEWKGWPEMGSLGDIY